MKLVYAFLLFSIYTTRAMDPRQKSKYYIVETYDEFKDGLKEAIDNYEAKGEHIGTKSSSCYDVSKDPGSGCKMFLFGTSWSYVKTSGVCEEYQKNCGETSKNRFSSKKECE